jgi:hypothetical protein
MPPRKNPIEASWNGGIGPATVERSARNAHVRIATKPIRVEKVLFFETPQAQEIEFSGHL